MTLRVDILSALQASMDAVVPGRVFRCRRYDLDLLPAIVVLPRSEVLSAEVLGVQDHVLSVDVDLYLSSEAEAESAGDALLADVLRQLHVDATLGLGPDVQVLPTSSVAWDFERSSSTQATIGIDIQYRTY
jgi:hypothetical protein